MPFCVKEQTRKFMLEWRYDFRFQFTVVSHYAKLIAGVSVQKKSVPARNHLLITTQTNKALFMGTQWGNKQMSICKFPVRVLLRRLIPQMLLLWKCIAYVATYPISCRISKQFGIWSLWWQDILKTLKIHLYNHFLMGDLSVGLFQNKTCKI